MEIFQKKTREGFTLTELLIAMGIFTILVAIGVGGFVRALHTQGEVRSLISVQDNASIALEQVTRELRTGYLFCNTPDTGVGTNTGSNGTCNSACRLALINGTNMLYCDGKGTTQGIPFIDFTNAVGQNVDYEIDNNGALARSQNGPGGPYVPLTGADVEVKNLVFVIFGNREGDHYNPRVTISFSVSPKSSDPALVNDVLNLQTSVSAREIDCTSSGPVSC